jgi:PAS domain S-box-containing protein
VHELQVHQIELEMQNDELRQSRAEVEAGLERYTELYDFAPVGYLTLGRDGAIRQVNLTGARLLGVARARLPGRRFEVFVGAPDRAGFKAFLEKVFASQAKEVCEVALLKDGKGPLNVHITATVSQDGQECRVMIEDITERKQAAAEMKRLASFPMLNPRPIVEVDVAGHVHFCNPVAEQMFPDLCQRGLGHPYLGDWESVLRTLRESGAQSIVREVHFDEKWYHQTIHFVDDAQRIRIYGADITARKKVEEALQKAHDELEKQVEERTVELRTALSEVRPVRERI